ncbi:MAG: hypothetical protein KGL18_02445 [Burkholderiales bacterium]|nr:hypothetical protein [Burkholderiales bacterium]MDE2501827.1 hypothetical protein [Burkholderiales bacterium]
MAPCFACRRTCLVARHGRPGEIGARPRVIDRADPNFDEREAALAFDYAKTKVKAALEATADAGYPWQAGR